MNRNLLLGLALTLLNTGIATATYTLPFEYELNASQFANECSVTDVNGDRVTWAWNEKESTPYYNYNDYKQADDWLWLPAIDFGTNRGAAEISIYAKVASYSYPESFEICIGAEASPEAMTPIMVNNSIKNMNFEKFTSKFTTPAGVNYIGIHATSAAGMFSLFIKDLSITKSADMTPAAPVITGQNIVGLDATFTLQLPAVSVDDIALEGNLTLVAMLDATEYSRTTCTPGSIVDIPVVFPTGRHTISFSVESGEGATALQSESVEYSLLAKHTDDYAYPLPYLMKPTLGDFETFDVLDADGDGNSWTYTEGTTDAMECRSNGAETSDDWVFLPKFHIEDITRIYSVSLQARVYTESYPESFDFCIGREATPAGMTPLISCDNYTNTTYDNSLSADWIAPESGDYFIAIHRRSDASAHTLRTRNIRVEDSRRTVMAPAEAEIVSVDPDNTGLLKASVTFKMPVVSINGTTLPADYAVSCTLQSETGSKATVAGHPGEEYTLSVLAPANESTLSLTTQSSAYGKGKTVTANVFCGLDIPSMPQMTAVVSDDNMTIEISWSDSERGENNGAVNYPTLSHNIYEPVGNSLYWTKIAELTTTETGYTYRLAAGAPQSLIGIGVSSVNTRGESQIATVSLAAGTPHNMPIEEDFSNGEYFYDPIMFETPGEEYVSVWHLDNPLNHFNDLMEEDGGHAMLCIRATESDGTRGRVALPKFSTVGASRANLMIKWFDSEIAPKASVYMLGYDVEKKIGELIPSGSKEWKETIFDIPADMHGLNWVHAVIEPEFDAAPQAFVMQGYKAAENIGSGIETIGNEFAVIPNGNALRILGAAGEELKIFTLDGRTISSTVCGSNEEMIQLATGIYVVKIGAKTMKINNK